MKSPLRILLVEDSEDDALFLTRELKSGGLDPSIQRVDTIPALQYALGYENWDLVISDHSLPGFGCFQALDLVRQISSDLPFIIVSGVIGEDTAVAAMKAGANDYVMKKHLARLVPSIERELREAAGRKSRREAEEALHRSESELNDFFEHAPLGLHWIGPEGTILRANESQLEMLGCGPGDFVGRRLSDFFVEEPLAGTFLERLRAGEALKDYEVWLRRQAGGIRLAQINANALWQDGNFVHARCFVRDITERRQGEEAVAYLAAIVNSSDNAIIGTTLNGTILSWNTGAERMYGYSAAEVKGRSISILVPPYRPEEPPLLYARIKDGEWISHYESVRLRKDGSLVAVSMAFSPIEDSRGNIIGISAIERDMTDRKREEEERLALIRDLTEALASIRTLRGLLPICASCKKIRDDHGYWEQIESYLSAHTDAEFETCICPECQASPEFALKS